MFLHRVGGEKKDVSAVAGELSWGGFHDGDGDGKDHEEQWEFKITGR